MYYKKSLKNATKSGVTNFYNNFTLIINELQLLITNFYSLFDKKNRNIVRFFDFFWGVKC